ncbi:MAG: hypothetical protein HGA67_01360 [Candidatus Yonathbacteria bacterium]|nr:hypothetical protein [Candidatus Yonathbacteria bacterium]
MRNEEPLHFFVSIPFGEILHPETIRYPFLNRHIHEASPWGDAHTTIGSFESFMPIYTIEETLRDVFSGIKVAPLLITIQGPGKYIPNRTQVILFEKNGGKTLKHLRQRFYTSIKNFVPNKKDFYRKKDRLSPIFHIGIGKTMTPANLETVGNHLRGKSISIHSLELEVRQGKRIVKRTDITLGTRERFICTPDFACTTT